VLKEEFLPRVALDVTAPDKLAPARLAARLRPGAPPTAAAQALAVARRVALPPTGAGRVRRRVGHTVVGRGVLFFVWA
jgi:hypothetical protein